ncbi:sialate O-acetylesterase [Leuconostoc pseudomesenteroides]|uniref:sialate O-acetylesterase n=1 Tax=Leuconostoc pseudomesenteroides TaxID=33968 RepID=UPI0039E8D117
MSDLCLSPLFGNGAILQRDKKTIIWGTANENSSIKANLGGEIKEAIADNNGQWAVTFSPHLAGEKVQLIINDEDTEIISNDIIFGDVWLLGGQSNMQLWMRRVATRYPNEIKKINNKEIRSFTVPQVYDFNGPQEDIDSGNWEYAIPGEIENFSAIGYFMAEKLYNKLKIPIGLIATAIGGTPIEAWLSENDLSSMGLLSEEHHELQDEMYIQNIIDSELSRDQLYDDEMQKNDLGLISHYEQSNFDDSNWEKIELDHKWSSEFQKPGVVWLRKKITIPSQYVGLYGQIRLGTVTDADEVYVDGQKVGETGYKYPPREYDIAVLKHELTIAIRIRIFYGNGGFTAGKNHYIHTSLGKIDLDRMGPWQIRKTVNSPIKKQQTFFQYKPTGLYNGMIAPLRQLAIKGIAFYQGESDTNRPENYGVEFQRLIQSWRKQFNQGSLPFIFVQLANLSLEPEHDWARLREEQRHALTLDSTGMVTTIDVGESNDLHPTNKQVVGERAANLALKLAYYENIVAAGPFPIDVVAKNHQIVVRYLNGEGLRGEKIEMILLTDQNRYQLSGIISDQTVVLTLPDDLKIERGWRLRYAWANNPKPILFNAYGLPAEPFEMLVSIV